MLRKTVTHGQSLFADHLANIASSTHGSDRLAKPNEPVVADKNSVAANTGKDKVVVTQRQCVLCRCMLCRLFTLLQEQSGTRQNASGYPATRSQSISTSSISQGTKNGVVNQVSRTHAPKCVPSS